MSTPTNDDVEWMVAQVEGLTETVPTVSPSEWAEENRYLPQSVTPMPGFYRYNVSPALREIVDCFDIRSPIREVTMKKAAQIGATVGVIENTIGYCIDQVKSTPVMLLTADSELAKMRMESYITPMIQQSGLEDRIRSSDESNKRKSGKTDRKIEWDGGGFLVPFGAQNANKLRSISIQYLLQDETDGYPEKVGKDGKPNKLAEARTNAYRQTRKIGRFSTPSIKGQSVIDDEFKRGDERYYFVPCRGCGKKQVLRFEYVIRETGERRGLVWETDEDGILQRETVRYLCIHCGHPHKNSDKVWMMDSKRAEWRATSRPISPDIRSYHLSALYAPATMFSWEDAVQSWLDAWDEKANRPKDIGLLQEFYNNVLGETFELRGNRLRFGQVSEHRRTEYIYGEVPNKFADTFAGSPVLVVTCAVDVHDSHLDVATFGWTRGGRCFLINYWMLEGNCADPDDDPTWNRLEHIVESTEYIADDGKRYPIAITFVDSGDGEFSDQIYQFCGQYEVGVYPIKGQSQPPKSARMREFNPTETRMGTIGYGITVDVYKDRWNNALRRSWDGMNEQPPGHFNAPMDTTDKQIRELTQEFKRERIDRQTGRRVGFEWYRRKGSRNELWDLLVYGTAALEVLAWDWCRNHMGYDVVDWTEFWATAENDSLFFTD